MMSIWLRWCFGWHAYRSLAILSHIVLAPTLSIIFLIEGKVQGNISMWIHVCSILLEELVCPDRHSVFLPREREHVMGGSLRVMAEGVLKIYFAPIVAWTVVRVTPIAREVAFDFPFFLPEIFEGATQRFIRTIWIRGDLLSMCDKYFSFKTTCILLYMQVLKRCLFGALHLFKWVSRLSTCITCSAMKGQRTVVEESLGMLICYIPTGAKWVLISMPLKETLNQNNFEITEREKSTKILSVKKMVSGKSSTL